MRPKHLPITGASVQSGVVPSGAGPIGAESSARLRDALATVGMSLEGAADALGVSASRVQAKTDPARADAPVTYADVLRLARSRGKGREVARILHADLGAELEDDSAIPGAMALPMLGMQFTVSALDVGNALQAFCRQPSEGARVMALRAIGSVSRVLATLRAMLANQRQ